MAFWYEPPGGSGSSGGGGITYTGATGIVITGTVISTNLIAGPNIQISGATISATGIGGGAGSLTYVGLSGPSGFTVSGSPVTSSGTITLTGASGAANQFYATPSTGSGVAGLRPLVYSDIPSLLLSSDPIGMAPAPTGVLGQVGTYNYPGIGPETFVMDNNNVWQSQTRTRYFSAPNFTGVLYCLNADDLLCNFTFNSGVTDGAAIGYTASGVGLPWSNFGGSQAALGYPSYFASNAYWQNGMPTLHKYALNGRAGVTFMGQTGFNLLGTSGFFNPTASGSKWEIYAVVTLNTYNDAYIISNCNGGGGTNGLRIWSRYESGARLHSG